MPTKGTAKHAIRIDDELWQAALAKAEANGTNITEPHRISPGISGGRVAIRAGLGETVPDQGTRT